MFISIMSLIQEHIWTRFSFLKSSQYIRRKTLIPSTIEEDGRVLSKVFKDGFIF